MSKAWRASEQRGPNITRHVNRAGDQERELRIKFAMLIGHMVSDYLLPGNRHAFSHANGTLQRDFAGVPGGGNLG